MSGIELFRLHHEHSDRHTNIQHASLHHNGTPYLALESAETSNHTYETNLSATTEAVSEQFLVDNNFLSYFDLIRLNEIRTQYTGQGSSLGVIDSGVYNPLFEFTNNFSTALSFDAVDLDNNPFPIDPSEINTVSPNDTRAHGTWVSSIAVAEEDGLGTIGVAPEATLAGFRMDFENSTFNQFLFQSEYSIALQANLDVSNNSWGYVSPFFDEFGTTTSQGVEYNIGFGTLENTLIDVVSTGRGGYGSSIVFSAGNSRMINTSTNTGGDDTNAHNLKNSIFLTSVASTDLTGIVSDFSTPGASILVSAPGEDIVATSIDAAHSNLLVSGTSFSSAFVSGVINMMLEANPNLGYRDIQEILAYSSYQSDPNHVGGAYSWEFNQGSHWNNGGLHFSNDYGFGMIDATAAVRLAESWSKLQTFHNLFFVSNASNKNLFIPDANPFGVSDTITLGGNIEIDKIEVDINIDHTWWGDLQIKLISPDNTESILLDRIGINPDNGNGINSGFGMIGTSFFNVTESNLTFTLTSNAFWGEQSAGDWTLQVIDLQGADTGTLIDWQLNVFGDLIDTNDLYVFTDEYATLASDPSRQNLNDTNGGNDTINLAAVRGDNVVYLSSNSMSTVANANLQINTSIENVIMGVGNDYVYANSKDNLIDGGEGNDIIYGYTGNDVIAGSSGADHLYAGSGADTVSGGRDDDFIQGNGGDDIILGDEGGDLLFGGKGNDLILGGENGDIILGNNDNDELYGENGDDNLFGGKGNDTLMGGNGADNLQGNSGNDLLIGGDQNDILIGTSGNDTLNGQNGDDYLNGGSGLDLFIISTGNDTVFSFKKGDDTLDYSQLGVTAGILDTNNDDLINALDDYVIVSDLNNDNDTDMIINLAGFASQVTIMGQDYLSESEIIFTV